MKTTVLLIVGIIFCSLFTLQGCKETDPEPPIEKTTTGVYVLNEGLFNQNNSSLTYFDFSTHTAYPNFFVQQNGRSLGDGGNDLRSYGSKLYAVMSGSSQLEVIDLTTGTSIKQLPMFDENDHPRQPRKIAFSGKYAYVCSFDGTVARLDTASLTFDAYVSAGRQPDGICEANGKLFVSNSGGLDYPDYDSTVSVLSTEPFEEEIKLTVGLNPGSIQSDADGNVFVISRGNYVEIGRSVKKIATATNEVTTLTGIEATGMEIRDLTAYFYDLDYASGNVTVMSMDTPTGEVEKTDFLDGDADIVTPYALGVDPVRNDIYMADALDYTSLGDVYCFDPTGGLKFSFEAGINPNGFVFVQE